MSVKQSIIPGFSKCPSHIWQYQDIPKCPSHNIITQYFIIVCNTFANTLIFSNVRHISLLTPDFPNVRHTFSNTKIIPNIRHYVYMSQYHRSLPSTGPPLKK